MRDVVPLFKLVSAITITLLIALLFYWPAAEAARNFPENARRGTITEHQYPIYKIDSEIYRIAAGGRILNQQNLIIMPASFHGPAEVMYRLDNRGELSVIWLLTREEAALFPKPLPREVPESGGR